MSYEPPKKKKPEGGFKRDKGTGEWIRDYLSEQGADYVQSMWREHKIWCQEKGYTPPTRESFRSYFNQLFKLGLVDFIGEEESDFGEPRRYYQVNPERKNDSAWDNPRKVLDEKRVSKSGDA